VSCGVESSPPLKIFMRIGLLDQTTKGWSAGATFTRMMLGCLELAKQDSDTEVIFLSRSEGNPIPSSFKSIFIGEQPDPSQWAASVKDAGLDVVIPVRDHVVFDLDLPFVGWIPDFQHLRLPELFSSSEIDFRNQFFSAVAEKSSLVLLSSNSARSDFEEFYPEQTAKARVAHFPSLLWTFESGDVSKTVRKFRLPQKFALVANQFWRHKNHRILPPALGLLKRAGIGIDLVVTGLPSDYRDPENKALSNFFQESAKEDVAGSIHFLGQIPYLDLVAIMRAATLIIQPSFFEGWSTSIEDSKALGRPLLCSDIPVHREQVPDALGFFDPTKPETLADLLASVYGDLPPGPDYQREEAGFALARNRAFEYGVRLLESAREAMAAGKPQVNDDLLQEREPESLPEETVGNAKEQKLEEQKAEVQRKYVEWLEARIPALQAEIVWLRKLSRDLKGQSLSQYLFRHLRPRWRLLRKCASRLRERGGRNKSLMGRLLAKLKHFRSKT
jgi:glycosyltransferase involved in cell wall biosynthesis